MLGFVEKSLQWQANVRQKGWICLLVILSFCSLGLNSCSDDGDRAEPAIGDITGTIRSVSGSQSQLSGWTLSLFERDHGISRVSSVGSIGNYRFKNVRKDFVQGMALLDPDFKLSAILSQKSEKANRISHFFQTLRDDFPTLIHAGPTIAFSDISGIGWDENTTSVDDDGDGVAGGLETFLADTDGDGRDNQSDADIDGDGLPNWFDLDDDGDSLIDVFDVDENGDETSNDSQTIGQTFFGEGLSYISSQVIQTISQQGTVSTNLLLLAKVSEEFQKGSFEVSIRGAESMFSGTKALVANSESGQIKPIAWDFSLVDDGLNNDGAAGDGVYARMLALGEGIVPLPRQMIFFRYGFKEQEKVTYYLEFPYLFPTLTVGAIAGLYDPAQQTFTRSGQPFDNANGYVWSVDIFDATGKKIYSSASISGSKDTFKIPPNVIDNSKTYTAQVLAMTIGRIPSQPTWIIRSAPFSL